MPGKEAVVINTGKDDSLSSIILALTKKREKLTSQAEQIRIFLADHARLSKKAFPARINVLAFARLPQDSMSFTLRLAIWLFLVLLSMLVMPFVWGLVKLVVREAGHTGQQG